MGRLKSGNSALPLAGAGPPLFPVLQKLICYIAFGCEQYLWPKRQCRILYAKIPEPRPAAGFSFVCLNYPLLKLRFQRPACRPQTHQQNPAPFLIRNLAYFYHKRQKKEQTGNTNCG